MAIGLSGFTSGSSLWKRYNASLKRQPLQTKALTCATAYAVGDLAAQLSSSRCRRLRDKVGALDVARTARMAMFGLMWTGCVGHYWYKNLDQAFSRVVMRPVAEIAGKVGIDQLAFSPAATAAFFVWMNLSNGTMHNLGSDMSTKLMPTIQASWMMWVPAMTVNMALIPAHMRILFINATAIVWTLILSSMASGSTAATEPARIEDPVLYSVADESMPLAAALAGLARQPRDQSNVVRDVWQFMRGVEQPRRSSKEHEPPARRFLYGLQMVARGLAPMPSFSRMQSTSLAGEDGTMLDAIMDDLAEPSNPSEAGSSRLTESLRGLALVDIDAECL